MFNFTSFVRVLLPQGEKQEYDQLKAVIQKLYSAQKNYVTKILADSKRLLNKENPTSEEEKEGAKLLFRAYRGLPKNKALIKFLSEPGMRTTMQKTENFFLQEQAKHMHLVDEELFFVSREDNHRIQG